MPSILCERQTRCNLSNHIEYIKQRHDSHYLDRMVKGIENHKDEIQ